MFYTTYKTTNLVNGKIYFGKHQTSNPYDGYLGSGLLLTAAIKKYGRKSFEKEVLGIHDTAKEMDEAEADLITAEHIASDQCYNLIPGGAGGRPSNGEGGNRRAFIDQHGTIIEGRACAIAWNYCMSQKKVSDIVSGRRKVYRGLRAA